MTIAEVSLADALAEATAAGRCDLEPLGRVLRQMAPLRQALGDKIHSSLVTPLESYSADTDKVHPRHPTRPQLCVRMWSTTHDENPTAMST